MSIQQMTNELTCLVPSYPLVIDREKPKSQWKYEDVILSNCVIAKRWKRQHFVYPDTQQEELFEYSNEEYEKHLKSNL